MLSCSPALRTWPARITCGLASVLENEGLGQGAHDKEVQEAAEPSSKEHGHCFPALWL